MEVEGEEEAEKSLVGREETAEEVVAVVVRRKPQRTAEAVERYCSYSENSQRTRLAQS